MNDGLAIAFVSITSTARRRFFWAVWWSAPPHVTPEGARPRVTKPDASGGGVETREAALAAAERAAGRTLTEIDGIWARAFKRTLQGLPAFTPAEEARLMGRAPEPRNPIGREGATPGDSIWTILGVAQGATRAEIKRAYRARALATHPDHGGDVDAFRAVLRAYDEALSRAARPAPRAARKRGAD